MSAAAEAIETAAAAPAVSWVPFAVIGAVLLAAGAAAWIFIRRNPKKPQMWRSLFYSLLFLMFFRAFRRTFAPF